MAFRNRKTGEIISDQEYQSRFGREKQTPVAMQEQPPQTFGQKLGSAVSSVGKFLGMEKLGQGIAGTIFFNRQEGKDLLAKLSRGEITGQQFDEITKDIMPSNKEVIGSAIQTAGTIASVGMGGGGLAKQTLQSGALGAVQGFGKGLEEEKTVGQAIGQGVRAGLLSATITGGIGLVGKGIKAGVRALKEPAKQIVSTTSGIPTGAMEKYQPGVKAKSLVQIRDEAVEAIRGENGLRKQLTQEYDDAVEGIVDTYGGQFKLDKTTKSVIKKVMPELTPTQGSGTRAVFRLYRDLNKITPSKDISPQMIETARKALRKEITDTFGKEASTLFEEYTAQSQILAESNRLINAWADRNPIAQSTSLGRLSSIFNKNKEPYLRAIEALDERMGTNFVRDIAGTKFVALTAEGSGAEKLIRTLLSPAFFPITSPKAVGLEIQAGKMINKVTGPVSKVAGEAMRRITPTIAKEIIK